MVCKPLTGQVSSLPGIPASRMIHESVFSETECVAGLGCDNDVIQHADVKKIPALPPDNAVHLAFRAFGGSLITQCKILLCIIDRSFDAQGLIFWI
jgi:hypothetical protein